MNAAVLKVQVGDLGFFSPAAGPYPLFFVMAGAAGGGHEESDGPPLREGAHSCSLLASTS